MHRPPPARVIAHDAIEDTHRAVRAGLDLGNDRRRIDRLSDQRDVLIRAMTRIFTLLNGGVFLFIIAAWSAGLFDATYRIVDSKTVMTLIGATVVQSGIAFIAITRFLFPSSSGGTDP